MKITLTYSELLALVRDRYSLPDNAELEISGYSGMDHPAATKLVDTLTRNECLTPQGGIRSDKKIHSIKLLRELVADGKNNDYGARCGLVQAKFAIEDWDNFLIYVRKNGFPPMAGNDPDKSWCWSNPLAE